MFKPDSSFMQEIDQWIEKNSQAFVKDLDRLVAIPSISVQGLSLIHIFHSVSIGSVQLLYIHMVRSPADLLIRGKQDAESGMGMLGMFCQKLHQCHDLRHTGLVIRAQKGGAVRDDQDVYKRQVEAHIRIMEPVIRYLCVKVEA